MEIINGILLTQTSTPIIRQIAIIMGKILELIFNLGIHNIGICIIILTFIVYFLMLPLTYKQQKFSKLSGVMNPEIQAIQKKYAGKKDQSSMAAMQEEQKAVYEKYGTSATGGCLNLLITMPLLFAFYRVVYNIPAYIAPLKNLYIKSGVVDAVLNSSSKVQKLFINMASKSPIRASVSDGLTQNNVIDSLWKFNADHWAKLAKWLPDSAESITKLAANIKEYTTFLCYNIAETPMFMMQNGWSSKDYAQVVFALLIPVLAGITQWLNIKLTPQPQQTNGENSMASSMKTMNLIMPLFSIYICFTLPIGLGLYWITAAVFRSIQQFIINKHLDKIGIDAIIESNRKKQAKKKEKQAAKTGVPVGDKLKEKANIYARSAGASNEEPKKNKISDKANLSSSNASTTNNNPKPGSLAAKANMVKKFNEGQNNN